MARRSTTIKETARGAEQGATTDVAGRTELGSTVFAVYHKRREDYLSVSIKELRSFQSSMKEEFWIFSLGGFLASGSFWIVLERFLTKQIDTLLWVCLVALVAGILLVYIANRWQKGRKTEIEGMIERAEAESMIERVEATSKSRDSATKTPTLKIVR